ncbi:MAG: PAS domain-containing protein, partial [Desulfarculaceae bacterium]|nr:PAS domain-containing protein [Desulfarculaceae bacterium]
SELIIGVTSFFRDPEAWQVLKEQALLPRLDAVEPGHIFRAWVPGCSSGEEAYSLAILIEECREQAELDLEFQVFGTDISPMAVAKAREGRYPKSIATDLSLERLKRFFREKGGNLVVRKDIRDRLVFSEQDLLRDPPFSHLDLLVCRNLLIYLNAEAQQKLLPLFHYTLRPGGLLFLGSSESVGRFAKLFETVEQKAKIYRRREVPDYAKPGVLFPTGFHVFSSHEKGSGGQEKDRVNGGGGTVRYSQKLGEQTKKMLLSRFVPAAVAVDDRGEIIYVHGRTGKYLEPAQGPLSMNVVKMAREGLLPQLSLLLQRCAQDGTPQRVDGLKVRTNGHTQVVNLNVELLERGEEGLRLLVVFQDSADPVRKWTPPPKSATIQDQQIIKDLQQELQETRESHQGALEELEGANEELKSTNEELQSTNEELQSTNEELESSREELQSMNEELNTTNQEMRSKMDEMSKMQDDMANLINSTRIATLFLDNDLNIRRFTPEAAELINLIDSDVGRPVHDLVSKLDYPALASDIRKVLRTLEKSQSEVGAAGNGWFRVRIIPYRTTENVIDGAVVTFTDITELRAARNYAESIVATVREPLLVLDRDLGVVSANRSFYDFFKTRPGETEGRLVYELGNGQWDIPRLRELLERIIPQQSSFEGLEVEHEFPGIGAKRLVLNARRLERPGGEQELILLAMEASSQIGGKD